MFRLQSHVCAAQALASNNRVFFRHHALSCGAWPAQSQLFRQLFRGNRPWVWRLAMQRIMLRKLLYLPRKIVFAFFDRNFPDMERENWPFARQYLQLLRPFEFALLLDGSPKPSTWYPFPSQVDNYEFKRSVWMWLSMDWELLIVKLCFECRDIWCSLDLRLILPISIQG